MLSHVLNISHGYMNYIHGIGSRISCMNIPWPITICSYLYLLTINTAFVLSSWSFKCLFYSSQIVKSFTYMTLLFQNCCPQATDLNTELHTLGNWQKSIAIYIHLMEGSISVKTPTHNNTDPGKCAYVQFNLKC